MEIRYCCTHWGSEHRAPAEFLTQLVADGYSGLEINLAPGIMPEKPFFDQISTLRSRSNFSFIGQLVLDGFDDTPKQLTDRMKERLDYLADFKPDFINAHTGRDFYSFDDNCRIIDAVENHAAKRDVKVFHETHRGRFSFHLPTLLQYLDAFPTLQLTADFSHFCTVSESLLEGQIKMLSAIIPHIGHLHARVGSAQSAQVANPFAPEWQDHLAAFLGWWQSVIDCHVERGSRLFTITPEAGPMPYMPEKPFSREPLANQWDVNLEMKNYLQQHLS